jgi:hypothetical protein
VVGIEEEGARQAVELDELVTEELEAPAKARDLSARLKGWKTLAPGCTSRGGRLAGSFLPVRVGIIDAVDGLRLTVELFQPLAHRLHGEDQHGRLP